MRILHVIQELGFGGAEVMVAHLVDGSRRAGHEVAVAAAPGPLASRFDVPRFELPLIRRAPAALLRAAGALRRVVRTWQPDVVHSHNPTMALAAALATARMKSPCKLVTMHGLPDEDYRLATWILRTLGLPTVSCGEGVQSKLREHGLETAVIVNGCDPPPAAMTREALERDYPKLRGRFLVFAAGRLVEHKNFSNAIRAVARLPDAALLIAGDGPKRGDLEREAVRLGVEDRVVMAGYRADVRSMIGAADVLMISSRWEGLPLVAIEAMMAGTPIVATDAPWQLGFLRHGDNGLVVPKDDPAATASAITRLIADTAFAQQLAERARETSRAHTVAINVGGYLDLYPSLASASP